MILSFGTSYQIFLWNGEIDSDGQRDEKGCYQDEVVERREVYRGKHTEYCYSAFSRWG